MRVIEPTLGSNDLAKHGQLCRASVGAGGVKETTAQAQRPFLQRLGQHPCHRVLFGRCGRSVYAAHGCVAQIAMTGQGAKVEGQALVFQDLKEICQRGPVGLEAKASRPDRELVPCLSLQRGRRETAHPRNLARDALAHFGRRPGVNQQGYLRVGVDVYEAGCDQEASDVDDLLGFTIPEVADGDHALARYRDVRRA